MGISAAWEQVDDPPDAVSFGLVPVDDGTGRVRQVMLWVWLLQGDRAVLVQPALRGADQPLPWGLRTTLGDVSDGAPARQAIRGFDTLVMPMIVAIEALLDRGLMRDEIGTMRSEAFALADAAEALLSRSERPSGG